MKIIIKGDLLNARMVRVETGNFIYDLSVCKPTGNLIVNKVDGIVDNKIAILPRYTNEIELV